MAKTIKLFNDRVLYYRDAALLPEDGCQVVIKFFNDLGLFYAAGIFKVAEDGNPLFIDTLTGNAYNWDRLVVGWAEL